MIRADDGISNRGQFEENVNTPTEQTQKTDQQSLGESNWGYGRELVPSQTGNVRHVFH